MKSPRVREGRPGGKDRTFTVFPTVSVGIILDRSMLVRSQPAMLPSPFELKIAQKFCPPTKSGLRTGWFSFSELWPSSVAASVVVVLSGGRVPGPPSSSPSYGGD